MRRALLVITLGLALGVGGGLAIGWSVPVRTGQSDPSVLATDWQDDWILMTAQAYSLDGDLEAARQRVALVGEAELGPRVAGRGQSAIAEGLPPRYIGALARLAAALGTRLPALDPYLAR